MSMKVASTGIIDGKIEERFGSRGTQFTENGMPSRSIPLSISGIPDGTVSFAIIMDDKDAVPVCGFSWIHWTAANIKSDLKENASVADGNIVQGANSYHSCASDLSRDEATGYGGPAPPDGEHVYDVTVYALDTELDLKNGFFMNELWKAMDGHVLAEAVLRGTYSNK